MKIYKLMKTYPFQVFRARIYLPWLSLLGLWQDFKRGIITQKIVELADLGINPNVGVRYESVSYHKIKKCLRFAKNQGFDTFLDIGCGAGRPLIIANEVGFKKIYGIDISSILIELAQKNLDKRKVRAVLRVCDVDNFEIPNRNLVIWLFNPFGKERTERLIEKLIHRKFSSLIIFHNQKFQTSLERYEIKKYEWNHFGLYEEKATIYLLPSRD